MTTECCFFKVSTQYFTNILPWCYWNMALHIIHFNKQPNDKSAVSLSLKKRGILICCALCRCARSLADEHWRVEADRKEGARGDIDIMTEILE